MDTVVLHTIRDTVVYRDTSTLHTPIPYMGVYPVVVVTRARMLVTIYR